MLFRPHWQELQQYILPDNGVALQGQFNEWEQIYGGKTDQFIVDGSATRYVDTFAAGMQSGLTSPSRPWFKLGLDNTDLANYQPVKVWLETIEERMRAVFDASNFYSSLHHIYRELPVFGTAAQIILEDYWTGIRCRPFTIGEYWIALDSRLRVDTLYRHMWFHAGQLAEEYGPANCSQSAQDAYNRGDVKQMFQVIQAIEPNPDRKDIRDISQKSWRSVHIELGSEPHKILRQSGFDEFPCQCPRWQTIGSKVWGRSRMMTGGLADVKMLQRFTEAALINYDKAMEPPVVAPPDLKAENINTIPGGVTHVSDMGNGTAFRQAYQVPNMLDAGEKKIESIQKHLQDWLFVNLFMMLANQPTRSNVTAAEMSMRHEEKLVVLGPVLERVHGELLDPSITRTFAIMNRLGMIPPPPPIKELRGTKIKVMYISALATAARMVTLTSMDQFIGRIGGVSQLNPEVLDNIDFDQYTQTYGTDVAVPAKMLRSPEAVAALRAARAKQQQAMQQIQTGQALAKTAKDASGASLDGNNALAAMVQNNPALAKMMGRTPNQQVPEES